LNLGERLPCAVVLGVVVAGASTRSPGNVEISAKIPVRDFLVSANIPTGLGCGGLF